MGFTARLLMIYCGKAKRPALFGAKTVKDNSTREALSADLKRIITLVGEMTFTSEAVEFIEEWYSQDNEDAPDHARLQAYNVRRAMTLQKIAMAVSAAKGNSLQITKADLEFSLSIMLEAESFMPEIFRGMNVPESSEVMAELYNYCIVIYSRNNKTPISEHMIIDFLRQKVEAYKIDHIMKHMVTSGLLKEAASSEITNGNFTITGKRFIPVPRTI
jgi:hypothetical protein